MIQNLSVTPSNNAVFDFQVKNKRSHKQQRSSSQQNNAVRSDTRQPVFAIGRRKIYNNDLQAALFALALVNTILVIFNFIQINRQ
ncbi:MAG: hypothetical protein FWF72_02195 [Paludibacter sp.]|nr:hypothetical protein [Paludibacter sp.]